MVLDVVEASLTDLQSALEKGTVTSVELVAAYLRRISAYDCRGPRLNAIPIINPAIFDEAAASDDRRAAGKSRGPLEGIPYTVKDSFKVRGLTVASGSAAFKDLVANEDAHTVQVLRQAGALMLGKTNMPPMAAGGMQRGVYGRAESPYSTEYLAAAFGSGSSNGSAVATTACFAAFGLGEETVSSGRSPASNNSLVAYTPSRGYISIRGNWPLYSTCDVVVPHTRTVKDLFGLLDVICQRDDITKGDFWRHQEFVPIPKPWEKKPSSFYSLTQGPKLDKVRVAVPAMFIGDGLAYKGAPYVSGEVAELWREVRVELEGMGVEVAVVDEFPVVTAYEKYAHHTSTDTCGLPRAWKMTERGSLLALAWEEFLQANGDPNLSTLHGVVPERIWPYTNWDEPQLCYSERENAIHWAQLAKYLDEFAAQTPPISSQYEVPNLATALQALEAMRKTLLEDWMADRGVDFVVFPAAGDVGRADADMVHDSARHAWANGVKYSNGNQALRHLGVPSVTVPMGLMRDKKMPVGLTVLGRAYDDVAILRFAWLVEQRLARRAVPGLTPSLGGVGCGGGYGAARPVVRVEQCVLEKAGKECGVIVGGVAEGGEEMPVVEVYVDGQPVPTVDVVKVDGEERHYSFSCKHSHVLPQPPSERDRVEGKIARDMVMVVVLARTAMDGKPTGWLKLLDV